MVMAGNFPGNLLRMYGKAILQPHVAGLFLITRGNMPDNEEMLVRAECVIILNNKKGNRRICI